MADAQYCFPTSGSLKHHSSNMCNSYCISCHSYGHPTLACIAQSKPKKPCWSSTSYYSAWLLSQPYQFLKRAPAPALRDLSRLSQMPLPPSNQSIPVHLKQRLQKQPPGSHCLKGIWFNQNVSLTTPVMFFLMTLKRMEHLIIISILLQNTQTFFSTRQRK